MDLIVEQLIELNHRDYFDIIGTLFPSILSIILIIQSVIQATETKHLQKQIHNRERINQYHSDILKIYNTYYEFCDVIIASGFENNVRNGNVNLAMAWNNNLFNLRVSIGRKADLAKLIFGRSNKELFDIIEDRFSLAIKIIDKYLDYINTNKMLQVSENAWATIVPENQINSCFKYNYQWLFQEPQKYTNFLKLCKSEELEEIERLQEEYNKKHSYDNFDKYFEKYFCLDEI